MEYDKFGRVTLDTSPGFQPFGFAGGLYDRDTGLVRFGARDYDAATGRWATKDPLEADAGTANLFQYAFEDPINQFDPQGRINVVFGVGGSAVVGAGGEGSVGVAINPSEGAGVFAAAGGGVGVNVSGDVFAGVVFGGIQNVQGTTFNVNFAYGPFSVTGIFDPQTGEWLGFTIGRGPNFFLFPQASETLSHTGARRFSDLFDPSATDLCGAL